MPTACAQCGANDREPLEYMSLAPIPETTAPQEDLAGLSARELIKLGLLEHLQHPDPAVRLCSVCRLAAGKEETHIWQPDPLLCATLGLPADYAARGAGENGAHFHPLLTVYAMSGAEYDAKWKAYTLEFVCVPHRGVWPGPQTWVELRSTDPEYAGLKQDYQIWRARVYGPKGTRVFLEMTFDVPQAATRLSLRGLESAGRTEEPYLDELKATWASRELLYTGIRRGRPPESGKDLPDIESFRAACHKGYAKVDAQGWKHKLLAASDEWLARNLLNCGKTLLYHRLAEFARQGHRISLDDIRQRRV
jgi:hypothetical protein